MICEVVAIDAGDNPSAQKSNKQDGVRKTQKRKRASLEPESKDVEIESLGKELDGLYKEVMGQGVPLNLQHCGNNAKPETVEKVCTIVRKQLVLPDDYAVTGESKFSALGADSLDTVEIVMGLEEEFGISVEKDSAQTIATIQDAAELIDKLIEKNKA